MSAVNNLLWVRYRDNFIFSLLTTMCKGQSLQAAAEAKPTRVKCLFAKVFRKKLTLEQWGTELDFLECHLKDIPRCEPLTMRRIHWEMRDGSPTPSRLKKLMNPEAPSTSDMLRTFILNEVKKCAYYRMTPQGATTNLHCVIDLMQHKQCVRDWWKPKMQHCVVQWGLHLPRDIALTARRPLRALYARRWRDLPVFCRTCNDVMTSVWLLRHTYMHMPSRLRNMLSLVFVGAENKLYQLVPIVPPCLL